MPASSKRANRVKLRRQYEAHTGIVKKAKKSANPKFDTSGETDEIARDLGNRKRFHEHDLINFKPLNPRQEDFLHAYFQQVPMIVATGVPGSAKTFLSFACALTEVFRNDTPYEKIVLVRSAVPTRELGHLPGDLNEKSEPYEKPYKSIVKELMPQFKDSYDHLKSLGYLEFCLTSHLRGITWNNTIVIFDEFQSSTFHELNTVMTRIGEDSRIILAGDSHQCDLVKRNDQSGFGQLMAALERMPNTSYSHVNYEIEDCVRGGLVRDWLLATY